MGRRPKTEDSHHKKAMFKVIGEYLKRARERAGVTQQTVAHAAGLTTPQYVSNIERGVSPPSVEFLRIILCLYEITGKEVATVIRNANFEYYRAEFGGL